MSIVGRHDTYKIQLLTLENCIAEDNNMDDIKNWNWIRPYGGKRRRKASKENASDDNKGNKDEFVVITDDKLNVSMEQAEDK
jgi:hypothetical protein